MLEYPPQLNITQSELAPRVADYFDNLLAQRDVILARYGLTPETAEQFCDIHTSDADREKILALYEKMLYVIENKTMPFTGVFIVDHAINPYAEALEEAGLPEDHPACRIEKEITIDIEELIAFQTKLYREQDMDVWADDIERNIEALMGILSMPEEQEKIKIRVKAGYIPIIMPSSKVQLDTWETALNNLKPVYIKEGDRQDIYESYINQEVYQQKITDFRHSCLCTTPERPYLVWTQPIIDLGETDTKWQTTDFSNDDLMKAFRTVRNRHPELCDEMDMHLLEYAALQYLATHTIEKRAIDAGYAPISLRPLDCKTWTRFFGMGGFANHIVVFGGFDPHNVKLSFSRCSPDEQALCGFRPAARS